MATTIHMRSNFLNREQSNEFSGKNGVHNRVLKVCQPIIAKKKIQEQNARCSLIRSNLSNSTVNSDERLSERQQTDASKETYQPSKWSEIESLKQVRQRTFSHWPARTTPSIAQMIEAGFFGCNVGDRVICFYCNLICQQWTPDTPDPCEVHKALSPKCLYVIAKLKSPPSNEIPTVNTTSADANPTNTNSVAREQVVSTEAIHLEYREIPRRYQSFSTWTHENSPSVDDLVRAGFFYTGNQTVVTCFFCNGSLQNWVKTDNPTLEHARWFPHCAYAKQLCGEALYRKIQILNQRRKGKNI